MTPETPQTPETPPTTSAPDVKADVAPVAAAPAGAVAKSTAAKVTVTCKLASSKRAVTCTVRGAKGTKLRAEAGARQGQGPSLRHEHGPRDTPVDKRLKATSKVTVKVTSGKTTGSIRARAGRKAAITLS